MKHDAWTCIVSESAARAILRAFDTCRARDALHEVSEILRAIRVQHPHLEREFARLPWPARTRL